MVFLLERPGHLELAKVKVIVGEVAEDRLAQVEAAVRAGGARVSNGGRLALAVVVDADSLAAVLRDRVGRAVLGSVEGDDAVRAAVLPAAVAHASSVVGGHTRVRALLESGGCRSSGREGGERKDELGRDHFYNEKGGSKGEKKFV